MSSKQNTVEFRAEAVKQVLERGFTVVDVVARISIPKHTLYGWVQKAKKAGKQADGASPAGHDAAKMRRLKAELGRRSPELGDEPKKIRRVLCQGVRARSAFMRAHLGKFRLCARCRVLGVHRSGYCAWLRHGPSAREREDQPLLGLIKHSWLATTN